MRLQAQAVLFRTKAFNCAKPICRLRATVAKRRIHNGAGHKLRLGALVD
jgi:hypothetical protein